MKVDRVLDVVGKAVGVAAVTTVCYSVYTTCWRDIPPDTERIKTEIQEKDPAKFEKIQSEHVEKGRNYEHVFWYNQLKIIDDSLKLQAIKDKAYFEGAQMVRDSIQQANMNKEQ